MLEIDVSPERLVRALLKDCGRGICLLDSCGVGRKGSNLLIAGAGPVRTVRLTGHAQRTLSELDELLRHDDLAVIFTLSYDFGLALSNLETPRSHTSEPHLVAALFDHLLIHDYDRQKSWLAGNETKTAHLSSILLNPPDDEPAKNGRFRNFARPSSNFTRGQYMQAVERIQELIRDGETYQTNLTQQITTSLPETVEHADVFLNLRRDHPATFAAYLDRGDSSVISASPEQFLRIESENGKRTITASPIKGTRPRGVDFREDERLRSELLSSEKDRAENTMIVDLMRNDLGRVCEFGSVAVEELCRLEEHPTLFHLVSTVTGVLRDDASFSDIVRATFPCGSITGAPKIRTMEIIDRIETVPRGLSMGAVGCRIPRGTFGTREIFEMSVAIRTMVIRDRTAVFNVGGGVVIDSDPAREYEESMLKAKALLHALGAASSNFTEDRAKGSSH